MTDDATSRARKAWQAERILATIADALLNDHEAMDCMEQAETIVASLNAVDFAIIDTRTHAAIPREPSDEVVERVFCVLAWGSPKRPPELADDEQIARAMAGNPPLVRKARAAIAALVAAQTQGGEREQ